MAHIYCRFIQLDSQFLDYKPSQQAAVSLLLAFNISQSSVAPEIGIQRVPELQMKSLVHDSLIIQSAESAASVKKETQTYSGPLRMWNRSVENLTSVKQ